jgi:hypothetical protein
MVFGVLKQRGPLLPKAPKGCGWRAALFFKELAEQAQTGNLRVAAVVQLKTVVKSQRRDHPEFVQLSYDNIHSSMQAQNCPAAIRCNISAVQLLICCPLLSRSFTTWSRVILQSARMDDTPSFSASRS